MMALSGLIAFRCCRCYGSHSRIGLETNHDEVCLGSSVCCTYTRNLDRFDHWYQLVPPFVLHSFHPEFGIAASSFNVGPRSAQQQSAQHLQASGYVCSCCDSIFSCDNTSMLPTYQHQFFHYRHPQLSIKFSLRGASIDCIDQSYETASEWFATTCDQRILSRKHLPLNNKPPPHSQNGIPPLPCLRQSLLLRRN